MQETFSTWLSLKESVQINHIDPEEDWEEAEKADQIARKVKIGIDRNKNLSFVAVNEKGDVVGALYSSVEYDHDASEATGENIGVLSFDVVVDPDLANPTDQTGPKLIKAGESLKNDYDGYYDKVYIRNYVVNKKLVRVMQTPKFGYDLDTEHSDGSAHMVKY
jgi:hypothetical protein